MNTTVAIVGPWCAGKTTFLNYVQQKFLGKTQADLVFPAVDKQQKRALTKKRNAALDDQSLMYEFLAHYIQNSAKIVSTSFKVLGPRQFLFAEQTPEYLDVAIQAARNVKLISHFQWCLLRTLLDEMAPASVADIFVLFSNEDYERCNNSHRRSGRSEHRLGAPLQKWNAEMERLHAEWVLRQRARGKIIFEVNSRISIFSRGLKVKKMLNVVFKFSNKTHGTAFSQFMTAEKVQFAGELNASILVPKVLIESWRQSLSDMPPKRRSESPKSGTVMEGMDAEGLHEDTVEYQRRVQGMMEANRRGIPPQTSSAGLPGFFRQGAAASGPSQGTRGRGRSAPPRREAQPFIDGRDRYGHPYEVQTRVPPRREPIGHDVSSERAALLRRLAELDEGQEVAGRRPSSVPPGSSRTYDYRGGYEPCQEPRYREREPVFRRQDQERMSDANIKSEMRRAASRMLSSAFGSDTTYTGGNEAESKEEDSGKEIVSEDSSGDDSDTLERKRKARLRNKDREAKRRRKEDLVLIPALRPDYRAARHHEEEQGSSADYGSGGFGHPQDPYYYERESYYDDERGFHREEGSDSWLHQGRDQRRSSPQPSQSWARARDQDHQDYSDEHRRHDQDAYGVGEEGEIQEDEEVSIVSETQQTDSPKFGSRSTKPAAESQPQRAYVQESTAKMKVQKSVVSSGSKAPARSLSSSASKTAPSRPKPSGNSSKGSKPLPSPEAPVRKIPKKMINKASLENKPQGASGGRKHLVTVEEMETAISNIKTEKLTPPKMTDTMMSTELKKFILSTMNDEMDLEMDVPASQVQLLLFEVFSLN